MTSKYPKRRTNSKKLSKISAKKKGIILLVLIFACFGILGAVRLLNTSHAAEALNPGEWNVECNVSHFLADDPIVYPGVPGASHMHSFYGNASTNAYSTPASLAAHDSTGACLDADLDNSAYWVPSVYYTNASGVGTLYNDKTSDAQLFKSYYRRPGGANGPKVQPIPVGLRMIAGDSKATTPQDTTHIYWDCGEEIHTNAPHNCGSGPMRAGIRFPSCWDGVHLDSADHKSHMAYANETTGVCPADHPVSLPAIEYAVIYSHLPWGPNYYLASGGIYSEHGDFFNTWNPTAMNALVTVCLNGMKDCDGMEYNSSTQSLVNDQVNIKLSDYTVSPSPAPTPPPPAPSPSPSGVPGDVNGDGHVNISDMSILLSHWNATGATLSQGDVSGDGSVNITDMSLLLSHWGI